jgi:uncharacterized protein (DUF1501 family)
VNGLGFKGLTRESPIVHSLLNQALGSEDRVLVIIYLNGGNDGLNTVIPLNFYSKYYNLRSNIAIPESKVLRLDGTTETGFHPAMTGMRDLFNQGKLAIVHSTAYPNPDLSHFRSTDIWMTGVDYDQYASTGWAGRYLENRFPGFPNGYPNEQMRDPLALQIGYVGATALLGQQQTMGITIKDPDSFYSLLGQMDNLPSTDLPCCEGGRRINLIRKQQIMSVGYSTEVKRAADAGKNLATYPTATFSNDLSEQLKIIARLIHGGLQTKIYFAELQGFDTHALQVTTGNTIEGGHSRLLKQLSDAIAAFQNDLQLQGTEDKVIGMTFSEFGRRATSNASLGTDHGVAAPLFVFGKSVKRQYIGTNPDLNTDLLPLVPPAGDLSQDIKMQIDFRRVYRDLLVDWLGATETTSNSILYKNFATTSLFSDTVQSLGSGMWPDRSIWSTGRMPGPNDIVVINSGHTVSVGQDITVKRVQVEGGGELSLLGNYKVTTS